MAVKIFRLSGDVSANNLIDENGIPTFGLASIQFADGFDTYVRVLAEVGGRLGYGYYSIDDISGRVTINSVKVFGIFRAGIEVPCILDSYIGLGIKTHANYFFTVAGDGAITLAPGETRTTSKTWTLNPSTGLAWTTTEIDLLQLYFFIYCGYYADPEEDIKVDCDVGYIEIDYEPAIPLVTTKDEINITNSSTMLNGEITDDGGGCTERGFEYYREGDSGNVLTIKQTGEFEEGEYGLTAGGLLAGTEYLFRAYALNEEDIGYGSWKSFITTALPPTVTTQAAAVPVPIPNTSYEFAEGNGTIETTGGQPGVYKCKERGFEVKLEFSGSLYGYIIHHIAGFTGSAYFNFDNFKYEGTLIKSEKESGSFGEGPFTLMLGEWGHFGDKLFAGESYTYRALATNDVGTGYGEWVAFSLGLLEFLVIDPEIIEGETTEIKNVTIQNLPEGQLITRIGIRYGTTPSANEFDIHIDGIFGVGNYEFVLTNLIPNTKYYQVPYTLMEDEVGDVGVTEGPLVESETLPEDVEPKDEFTTPYYGPHGQDYREVVKKVFAEKLSVQPIIDFSGGKKTLKLDNHLIQEQNNALIIADDYLSRFQFAKTKMIVECATPMPFEREDTIDFDFGRIPFKLDGEGVIPFRADGQGQIKFLHMVSVMVRKVSLKMGTTGKTIEYLATLELEKE